MQTQQGAWRCARWRQAQLTSRPRGDASKARHQGQDAPDECPSQMGHRARLRHLEDDGSRHVGAQQVGSHRGEARRLVPLLQRLRRLRGRDKSLGQHLSFLFVCTLKRDVRSPPSSVCGDCAADIGTSVDNESYPSMKCNAWSPSTSVCGDCGSAQEGKTLNSQT